VLLSMTGHGAGAASEGRLQVTTEIRSINNRFLKVSVRCSDAFGLLDTKIEEHVRAGLKRGTVTVNVRIHREWTAADVKVDEGLLEGYIDLVLRKSGRSRETVQVEQLLSLPGVVGDPSGWSSDLESIWPTVERSLESALGSLAEMRQREGQAMADDLARNLDAIESELERVVERCPLVVAAYQDRMVERLHRLLEKEGVEVTRADVIREVGIFSDRCDVSEEIVRLRSHLEQFRRAIAESESAGRKLDFITQEMFRETNTIGSKSNDGDIARHVVAIKTVIERIREMVQNVE